jgi:hypothetical protein
MSVRKLISLLILFMVALAGCANESKELTAEEKYAVDTIFNRQINGYHNFLDSMCKARRDSLYQLAVDSIKRERIAEIEMFMFEIDSLR